MTSPQHSGSKKTHRHALELPELVHIVCNFLKKQDYVNLLYLSRDTCAAVLPVVWEEVDFWPLFHLVPGTKIGVHSFSKADPGYLVDFPHTTDLTRFDIYSPYVKTIRTSRPYLIYFPGRWHGPGVPAQPLLPNLRHLIITTFGSVEADYVNWVPWFLHPGLLGLEMFSIESGGEQNEVHSWLDQRATFYLIDQIACTCPRIEALRLFPAKIADSDVDDCAKIYNRIADLHHLRTFGFSGTMVHQELLEILGRLPYLETLSLHTDWEETWEYDESPLEVPDDSFPSLKHLYLYGLDESAMSRVCKVPSLFRHLIQATIIFEDQDFDENLSDNKRSNVAVECLGQNSPHIQDLTILPRGNNGWFVVSWPVINAFKYMPLKCLRFGEVTFYSTADNDEGEEEEGDESGANNANSLPDIHWEDFLASVPYLEELWLEQQELHPSQLPLFAAHLPKLKLLVFGSMELGYAEGSSDLADGHVAKQSITLRGWSYTKPWKVGLDGAYAPIQEDIICNAAKYIFAIWPNATCEALTMGRDASSKSDGEVTARLNEAVKSLKAGDK
ncbi:hypothetical protein FRC07_002790 [Ceratobasidium sp. 392]|nr:hypothetical protein FRC07_002790 [Ceratobasidium sp. 392]